jgi:hypothetical protein
VHSSVTCTQSGSAQLNSFNTNVALGRNIAQAKHSPHKRTNWIQHTHNTVRQKYKCAQRIFTPCFPQRTRLRTAHRAVAKTSALQSKHLYGKYRRTLMNVNASTAAARSRNMAACCCFRRSEHQTLAGVYKKQKNSQMNQDMRQQLLQAIHPSASISS